MERPKSLNLRLRPPGLAVCPTKEWSRVAHDAKQSPPLSFHYKGRISNMWLSSVPISQWSTWLFSQSVQLNHSTMWPFYLLFEEYTYYYHRCQINKLALFLSWSVYQDATHSPGICGWVSCSLEEEIACISEWQHIIWRPSESITETHKWSSGHWISVMSSFR